MSNPKPAEDTRELRKSKNDREQDLKSRVSPEMDAPINPTVGSGSSGSE